MVKTQKTKMIAIIALVVAICGMTLGFAAFSNTLTISSSATVTPNDSDFNMKAYGVFDLSKMFENVNNLSQYASDVSASGFVVAGGTADVPPSPSTAIIDNNGKVITISSVSAELTGADQRIVYYFIIKNEGLYKSYLDFSKFDFDEDGVFNSPVSLCNGSNDASSDLVVGACDSIYTEWQFYDSTFSKIEYDGMYEIEPNEFIMLTGSIVYGKNGILADGSFEIDFDTIEMEFSSSSGDNN